jgi:hypothetical protein
MKKKYVGGCHCGFVRYEADIDLSAGTFKCNCEICTKKRMWGAIASPRDFQLLSGEPHLKEYHPNGIHHLFCERCGVHSFAWGENPDLGGKFYAVMVACLDNVDPSELIEAPVIYFDGRHDNYQSPPAETRHL